MENAMPDKHENTKDQVVYCIESRRRDERCFRRSYDGVKDKKLAMTMAENAAEDLHVRVIEQRRTVIKVFRPKGYGTNGESTCQ
jgi:hypothetical protein